MLKITIKVSVSVEQVIKLGRVCMTLLLLLH
jgi:hypothetical protein